MNLFDRTDLDPARVAAITGEALLDADDGELFVELSQSESLVWDDGRLRSASFDTAHGFGLRAVAGEATGFAHSTDVSEASLKRAAATVSAVARGHAGTLDLTPTGSNRRLYVADNPLGGVPFEAKVAVLKEIDAYARARDPRVHQVTASIAGSWQQVAIIRPDGRMVEDVRPLVRVNVAVVCREGDRMESGSYGSGGRTRYDAYIDAAHWRNAVDEAVREATVKLESVAAPAGEMTVVLGPGWPGVLLHEAVGHGLEGDFNRKKTSAFAGLMGSQVAARGVTVVDEGDMPDRRGSLTVDDEGTPTGRTVLIEDGKLVGYMQDRMNARLMGMKPTGNGRRESFAHAPMPRMTNTYMMGGDRTREEILASVKKGLYAVNFGGGQVDITNGKFVFAATEAYLIEDGRVTAPVKGATIIGNGPDALTKVTMVGDDMALDPGVGVCGKDGQGVPVGVGQPTLRIDGLTVGGTAV
ncbi:MAG: metalloprotease TldD [Azospirillaceae bacterium]